MEGKKTPYLTSNDPKRRNVATYEIVRSNSAVLSQIRNPTYQTKDIESKLTG